MRKSISNWLKLAGAMLAVITYSIYYNISVDLWPNAPDWMFNIFFRDGFFLSFALILFGIGVGDEGRVTRFLVYYPCGFFFAWMIVVYRANQYFNDIIDMNKIIFVTSSSVVSCLFVFLFRPRK